MRTPKHTQKNGITDLSGEVKNKNIAPDKTKEDEKNGNITSNEMKHTKNTAKPKTDSELIIKSGATDLRRGIKALPELTENVMQENLQDGNMYAFANKARTNVKIIQQTENGTAQYQKKLNTPIDWFEYQKKGTEGYTVTLTGKEKADFLKTIKCPKHL